ncbi:ABC transporter permease [Thermomonas haemolytica]|uniref:Sodium transport system permease protein n=1 Tax=Thermomonas haemolytica TaxID=141949 RepID=A0A4R3NAD3_9GAMM|nr:ABC transporter permease [Thermomonas haemolytica]TCT25257.1 sodium transport system permease protein [Thermomonas haemolytica]TNY29929.1 sodium ABC transporter permease [Thermomonas haemolytica]
MNTPSFFATLLTVAAKEWRDFARDRRTFFLSLLVAPLLYPLLFLGIGKLTQLRAETQLEKPLSVPVLGIERAPNLMKFLASYGIDTKPAPADIEARVRAQQEDLALAVDPGFAEDWRAGKPAKIDIITDTTRRNGDVKVARVSKVLESYGAGVGALRLLVRGIDPAIATPLHVGTRDMATPEAKNSQFMAVLLPMILTIFAFIGGAHLAMDTTAGERERQSLEPLLATPAPRGALVGGKMLAATALGLASLLLILVSFKVSATLASGMAKQMDVSVLAMGKLLLTLLPLVLIGTALMTALAAGAKSMKEAQSHIMWLMLMPMLPAYGLMAYPLKDTAVWQYAVPFLAQNQLIQKITRGESASMTQWGLYLACSLALAALLWALAVWRYRQEKLAISA